MEGKYLIIGKLFGEWILPVAGKTSRDYAGAGYIK
jgi:hypothetical protein